MSLDIHQIAEAFSTHKFAETYPYMADAVKRNIIVAQVHYSREAVIAKCVESAKFLETVSTTFTKKKITRADTIV